MGARPRTKTLSVTEFDSRSTFWVKRRFGLFSGVIGGQRRHSVGTTFHLLNDTWRGWEGKINLTNAARQCWRRRGSDLFLEHPNHSRKPTWLHSFNHEEIPRNESFELFEPQFCELFVWFLQNTRWLPYVVLLIFHTNRQSSPNLTPFLKNFYQPINISTQIHIMPWLIKVSIHQSWNQNIGVFFYSWHHDVWFVRLSSFAHNIESSN